MLEEKDLWFGHEACPSTTDTREFINYVANQNQPIILRNGGVIKAPTEKWTKEYLKSGIDTKQKHKVFYSKSKEKKRFLYSSKNEKLEKMNILSFFKTVESHSLKEDGDESKFYFYFQSELTFEDQDKPVMQELKQIGWDVLKEASKNWGDLTKNVLFINSNHGTVTPVHYDEQQNIFGQIRGWKRIIMFPPGQFPHLYPYPVNHPNDRQCQVDLSKPDFERWPKLDRLAKGLVCDIGPGDLLHIPSYWFHEVHTSQLDPSDELNISMNFWYLDAPATAPTEGEVFTAKNYLCITRNIEKMLSQVVSNPERDVGSLLKMITEGRFPDSQDFKMDHNLKQNL